MNLVNMMCELGPFTVLTQLDSSHFASIPEEIQKILPQVQTDFSKIPEALTQKLQSILDTLPENIIFAGPELIFLEAICQLKYQGNVHVVVPSDLPNEILKRISLNIPCGVCTSVHQIPQIPNHLNNANSQMLLLGFAIENDEAFITKNNCNVLQFYSSFYDGKIQFVNPVDTAINQCHSELWQAITKSKFFA